MIRRAVVAVPPPPLHGANFHPTLVPIDVVSAETVERTLFDRI